MTDLYLSDLSDWNPGVNFVDYAAGGRPGVFLKATEGTGFVASTFAPYRSAAHAAGLAFVGLYHFAKTNSPTLDQIAHNAHPGELVNFAPNWTVDHRGRTRYHREVPSRALRYQPVELLSGLTPMSLPAGESGHFLSIIGALQPGEVAVLDAEVPGLSAAWARAWLQAVEEATGRTPMLYCSWSFWSDVLGSMTDYPLWIAAYHNLGHDDPRDSVPNCRFWQYTDNAEVPGVGSCDDSVFRGSVADLAALAGGSVTPPGGGAFVPGTHVLTFLHSGFVLDVGGASQDDGAQIVQWPLNGQKNQLVRLEDAGDGHHYVVFEHSGKVLDHDPGADVLHQWTKIDGNPNQLWRIDPASAIPNGVAISLISAADGKAVDLPAFDPTPGERVSTWEPNGGPNQLLAVTTL